MKPRMKRILISGHFLVSLMEEGEILHAKCIKGLPKDCRFLWSIPDTWNGIWIVIEHPSFEEINDGDIIPIFEHKPEFIKL